MLTLYDASRETGGDEVASQLEAEFESVLASGSREKIVLTCQYCFSR